PPITVRVRIPWRTSEPVGPAAVTLSQDGGQTWGFVCARVGDWFREMNLEIDVCESVSTGFVLPRYNTHVHPDRPADIPARDLSIEECYREAGVRMAVRPDRTVIDDTAADFQSWSAVELHDAMERYFSQYQGPWPNWEMWGLLAGQYEKSGVGGVMFDAAAAYGGAGRGPDRQGFAVFRKHNWFKKLPAAAPADKDQAEALRKFLYTWVHEAGHAFNFLHSWDKNRPDALSWMNYDWKYDANHGDGAFWRAFRMRFDDEELIHLRHGDRPAVMMGGDPWASGGHAESPAAAEHLHTPPGAMAELEGRPPLELLLRSKGYFEFMEPVHIEFRLRNLLEDIPLKLDIRMGPEYGGTTVYIRRPDGRVVEYDPILCLIAETETKTLDLAADAEAGRPEGPDRVSETVFLSYGKYGFYFDAPGEYLVRAVYRGAGDVLIPSNMLRVRVGTPQSKAEDRLAQDYFSYQVGMALYLGGSPSEYLKDGMKAIRDVVKETGDKDSMLKAKLSTVLAEAVSKPFHRVEVEPAPEAAGPTAAAGPAAARPVKAKVVKVSDPNPDEALKLTKQALAAFHAEKSKDLNLMYRNLVEQRVGNWVAIGDSAEAKKELNALHRDLKACDANTNILDEIKEVHDKI
ncbi:MAG TPA: hypothetical protein VKD90_11300, partial [Gemmataceae bacterium]|nr:hypothetical protein [Gemmataceae bacterium]